jgi:hypothetical protein
MVHTHSRYSSHNAIPWPKPKTHSLDQKPYGIIAECNSQHRETSRPERPSRQSKYQVVVQCLCWLYKNTNSNTFYPFLEHQAPSTKHQAFRPPTLTFSSLLFNHRSDCRDRVVRMMRPRPYKLLTSSPKSTSTNTIAVGSCKRTEPSNSTHTTLTDAPRHTSFL